METYTLILIIIALLLSVVVSYFQYYYKEKKIQKISILLFSFRTLSLFLLSILLINPTISKNELKNKKSKLSVLIDNSASIHYFKKDTLVKEILKNFKSNELLNNKFDINYYSFGVNFKINDSLTFKEKQTNISYAIKTINKIHKEENSALVFISDGNQTYGNDYEYEIYNKPVFPIIIGDTTTYEDVEITQLNVNRYSFKDNKFPVEALLKYEGLNNVKLKYTIENKGRIVFSKVVSFNKNNNSEIIKTVIKASEEGQNFYKAKIESLENEKNISNNVKDFSVEIIDKQSEILIVSSIYHPDLGALKKSIEKDKQRKVTIQIINDKEIELNKYQLVILYQPDIVFKSIINKIQKNTINYMLVTGTKTNWSFINDQNLGIQKNVINQNENYSANFNAGYLIFSQKDIGFNNFPPLKNKYGETNIYIPHQTLLFQNINSFSSAESLLATSNEKNHKKVFLLGEGIWKWRSQSYLMNNSFEKFDSFIGNIIQYASSKKIRNRLDVDIESIYNANSEINVSAFYVDDNFKFDARATLIFTSYNIETKETKSIPFSLKDNSYQLVLESLESGNYDYKVTVEGQNVSKKGVFKISEFDIEQQFINANNYKLERIAKKSKGSYFYESEQNLLISKLLEDKRFVTVQKTIETKEELINWKWLLFAIVGLLSFEWFIRKYYGKI